MLASLSLADEGGRGVARVRFSVPALPVDARADTVTRCQREINFLPFTANAPGTYCLHRNLSTSMSTGSAITVNANDVTIDLKGFKIDGTSAGAGTLAYGVSASSRRGVIVRNGRIRGFFQAVAIFGTGTVIEDLALDSNTHGGVYCEGTSCTVRRNRIWNSGGAVLPPPGVDTSYGIANYSDNGQTYDNDVSSFQNLANQFPIGIQVGLGTGSIVRGNRVIGPGIGTGLGIGVANLGSSVLITGNEIVAFQKGIDSGLNPGTACRASLNRLFDVATPVLGCTDAGDNN